MDRPIVCSLARKLSVELLFPCHLPPFHLSTEVAADEYTVSCLQTDINHVRVEVVIESHIKYIESGIGRVSMDLTLCAFAI